jgi:hypothetical protein
MKIRSPHTTGDDPLHAGISCFHLIFCSRLHVTGRFFAVVVVPSPFGPRHDGQFAADALMIPAHAASNAMPQDLVERQTLDGREKGNGFMVSRGCGNLMAS